MIPVQEQIKFYKQCLEKNYLTDIEKGIALFYIMESLISLLEKNETIDK